MSSRKHQSVYSSTERNKHSFKIKETHITNINPHLRYCINLALFLSFWVLLLVFFFPHGYPRSSLQTQKNEGLIAAATAFTTTRPPPQFCHENFSVYVYQLPRKFNLGLLQNCRQLNIYTDMCPHVANQGLGRPIADMGSPSWFATHQFIAEMIFHARMENHPCRTWDPHVATLFYVPFYGGLHASSKFREPDLTERDALAVELIEYVLRQPWWNRHGGRDHFLALGRTAWDFMRTEGPTDFGANRLLYLPPVKNMSVLTVERHPWKGSNQHGIPYPSYFHPSTSVEMTTWMKKMRRVRRLHLFSFVGPPRVGVEKAAIRDEIIRQCAESSRCDLVKCSAGASKCHEPAEVVRVMSRSEFCLQAPGDSFTRRSTFDSIMAGCIPVFFSEHTAYSQYEWFLPVNRSTYSVYVEESSDGSIEGLLARIPREEVRKMRNTVIDLIPTLTYFHPNATEVGFRDAVDVALLHLSKHVESRLSTTS